MTLVEQVQELQDFLGQKHDPPLDMSYSFELYDNTLRVLKQLARKVEALERG